MSLRDLIFAGVDIWVEPDQHVRGSGGNLSGAGGGMSPGGGSALGRGFSVLGRHRGGDQSGGCGFGGGSGYGLAPGVGRVCGDGRGSGVREDRVVFRWKMP